MNQQENIKKFYTTVINAVLSGKHPFYFAYQLHAKNIGGKNQKLSSAESLTRFPKYHGKDVSPYLFYKTMAEMTTDQTIGGDSEDLQKQFLFLQLEKFADELEKNIDSLGRDFVISFNINTKFFNDEFRNKYLEVISNHPKLSQKNIAIEFTELYPFPVERSQAKECKKFIRTMTELQCGGTTIALDDFDTDFSDERVLASFPFDVVKIDYSKFKFLINQLLRPDFEKHFDASKNQDDEICQENVLDVLIETLELMKRCGLSLPKKVICEGLCEGSCPKDPTQNIPQLISFYYGDRLFKLGYDQNNFLYQGYEINVPFKMEELVESLNLKQPSF